MTELLDKEIISNLEEEYSHDKLILVQNMTYEHILNCIRMLNRKNNIVSEKWIELFQRELFKRSLKL